MIEAELKQKITDKIRELPTELKPQFCGLFSRLMELYGAEEVLEKSNLENNQKRGAKITNYSNAVSDIANGITEVSTVHLGNLEEFFNADEVAEISPKTYTVPKYWLTALKKVEAIGEFITEADEALLEKLTKIDLQLANDSNNYSVVFHFSENDFITNTSLTLKFLLDKNEDCEKIESDKIDWKADKCLTEKTVTKTQTNKKTKKKREVTKTVKQTSFFHVFKTRSIEDEDDEDEEDPDEDAEPMYYDAGTIGDAFTVFKYFASKYHGASLFGATIPDYEFDDGFGADEDGEDDDDEDEDDDAPVEKPKKAKKRPAEGGAGGAEGDGKEECKKQ